MKNTKTLRLTQLALLIAIELVLAYTPLGYIRTLGLEITFLMIPVTLGGILLGPLAGAVLGTVFGLTSFGTCFGVSLFGSTLLSINPVLTFVVCVVPRVLAGWLPGLLFKGLHTANASPARKNLAFGAAALAGPVLNTLLFMGGLVLCFYNTEYIQSFVAALGAANPFMFIVLFVGIQGAVEAVVCFILSGLLGRILYQALRRTA